MQDINLVEAAQDVLESLTAWRSTRRHRDPIPEELWAAAIELARRHGVCPTARILKLHYRALKRRMQRVQDEATGATVAGSSAELAMSSRKGSPSATFIEWAPAAVIGSCVIHVESRLGASMRVDLHQVPPDALAAIIRTFAE